MDWDADIVTCLSHLMPFPPKALPKIAEVGISNAYAAVNSFVLYDTRDSLGEFRLHMYSPARSITGSELDPWYLDYQVGALALPSLYSPDAPVDKRGPTGAAKIGGGVRFGKPSKELDGLSCCSATSITFHYV